MAQVNVNFSTEYDDFLQVFIAPLDVLVNPGDTIRYTWTGHSGTNQPSLITLTGHTTASFTTANNPTFSSVGGQFTKTVRTNPTNFTANLQFTATGYTTKNFTVNIYNPTDTVPDPFNLGNTINNVNRSTYIVGASFRVAGLSAGTSTFIRSSVGQYNINGGSYSSAERNVQNGDLISVRVLSSSAYNTTRTMTLNIGTVTNSWSVKTRLDPGDGVKIPLGITTGNIDLKQIGDLFGRASASLVGDTTLGNYYRGGIAVPDISENSSIPTSGDIDIGDFRGTAAQSLYMEKYPSYKGTSRNSTTGNATIALGWSTMEAILSNSDFYVGYGEWLRNVCEYKYEVSFNRVGPVVTTPNHTNWSTANRQINIELYVPQGLPENDYTGTITFYARHKLFDSYVLESQCDFLFFVYGN